MVYKYQWKYQQKNWTTIEKCRERLFWAKLRLIEREVMKWSFLLHWRWKDLASTYHTSGSMKYSISICSNSRERKRNCLQARNFARPAPRTQVLLLGGWFGLQGFLKHPRLSLLNSDFCSDFVPGPKVIPKQPGKKQIFPWEPHGPMFQIWPNVFWENLNPECHSEIFV